MNEIIFNIEEDLINGYVAKAVNHSIYTQGDTIEELKENIKDAIQCHFENVDIPQVVRLKFVRQEIMELA